MNPTRRQVLGIGGVFLAGLIWPSIGPKAQTIIDIRMQGDARGSHVWFDPVGLRIEPGQTVRWINLDAGNSHTATAYHPRNDERSLRIPRDASPWDSGYLLPEEEFSVTLTQEGVYDYYCIPHEQAGMVGRIIVGAPHNRDDLATGEESGLPEAALTAFPPVDKIMREGVIHPG